MGVPSAVRTPSRGHFTLTDQRVLTEIAGLLSLALAVRPGLTERRYPDMDTGHPRTPVLGAEVACPFCCETPSIRDLGHLPDCPGRQTLSSSVTRGTRSVEESYGRRVGSVADETRSSPRPVAVSVSVSVAIAVAVAVALVLGLGGAVRAADLGPPGASGPVAVRAVTAEPVADPATTGPQSPSPSPAGSDADSSGRLALAFIGTVALLVLGGTGIGWARRRRERPAPG